VLSEEHRAALKDFKPKLLQILSDPQAEAQVVPKRESLARLAGPGLIKIRDPFTNEWHAWPAAKCLPGVVAEANSRRKGDRWSQA
jgi:hypothetical protein